MDLRFSVDPETGEPHLYRHGISEDGAEDVLTRPLEDRPGRDGAGGGGNQTAMDVPVELVPATRELIARRRAS